MRKPALNKIAEAYNKAILKALAVFITIALTLSLLGEFIAVKDGEPIKEELTELDKTN